MNELTAARLAGATRSRTMWLALAASLLGVIQVRVPELRMDPQTAGYVLLGIGLLQAVIRWVTDSDLAIKGWLAGDQDAGPNVGGTD